MKKLGFSEFAVEPGEEIELTISSSNMSPHRPIVYLDGVSVEPIGIYANTTSYKFQIEEQIGISHQCVVRLPDIDLENAGYKLELFGAGMSVAKQMIRAAEYRGLGNLIYTFSTHGSGGGSNK